MQADGRSGEASGLRALLGGHINCMLGGRIGCTAAKAAVSQGRSTHACAHLDGHVVHDAGAQTDDGVVHGAPVAWAQSGRVSAWVTCAPRLGARGQRCCGARCTHEQPLSKQVCNSFARSLAQVGAVADNGVGQLALDDLVARSVRSRSAVSAGAEYVRPLGKHGVA